MMMMMMMTMMMMVVVVVMMTINHLHFYDTSHFRGLKMIFFSARNSGRVFCNFFLSGQHNTDPLDSMHNTELSRISRQERGPSAPHDVFYREGQNLKLLHRSNGCCNLQQMAVISVVKFQQADHKSATSDIENSQKRAGVFFTVNC